jgi:hypothetical protein
VVLAVCPDVLYRIQFRRVGRQVFDFQTAFLVADELLRDFTAVSRKPVPNQQNVALDVAQQVFKKLDDLLGLDGFFEDLKVEIPDGDAGDDRERFPVEVKLEDGCLPARRLGTPPMRPLAQAAFVYEDDRSVLVLGFFLISGQRLRFHSSIKPSLRSRARPTGCCTLQFNCRRMRQTCPG